MPEEEASERNPARRVRSPERLTPNHDLTAFQNGRHQPLDDWLKRRALASEGLSARTYVVCDADHPARVVGYYALSTAMEQRLVLPSAKLRSGTPDEIPLLLIGRLAIDQAWQGMGLGSALVSDALRRCLAASDIAGVRAVIVHAIDDGAVEFYQRLGFIPSPLGLRVLIMPIESIHCVFSGY
jgi:GNAT superfamily N-acetyltransferase